jgi:cytochrome oxidase Cu insertion factor (SCO1/SenC/PrrC family)
MAVSMPSDTVYSKFEALGAALYNVGACLDIRKVAGMNEPPSTNPPETGLRVRQFSPIMWAGAGLTAALILLAIVLNAFKWQTSNKPLPVLGQVADFSLTNQDGQNVTLKELRGHVWVADIIFTRCAGPCLKMSRQMKDLQEALPASSNARLVSLTTDPAYDSPKVLKTYAGRFGADSNRWVLLTGMPEQISNLATNSLKLVAMENPGEPGQPPPTPANLFIHSTILVLVDKQAQLRAVFQTVGEGIDPQQTKQAVLAAIRQLERES